MRKDDDLVPGDWVIHSGPGMESNQMAQYTDPWGFPHAKAVDPSRYSRSAFLLLDKNDAHITIYDPFYDQPFILDTNEFPSFVRATDVEVLATWKQVTIVRKGVTQLEIKNSMDRSKLSLFMKPKLPIAAKK